MKGRPPDPTSETDKLLQIYIRRANLDAFWSRRPGTVAGLRRLFFSQVEAGETFEFELFGPLGPFPRDYESGIRSAIGVLWQSQKPGRHEEKQKYSSVRKVRSLFTNLYNASAKAAATSMVWRSEKARFVATTAPSDSEWHTRFMSGLHARVGDRRKRDAAISIAQMITIQELLEEDWEAAVLAGDVAEQRAVAETACFFLVGYCASLRGFELPKIVLTELRDQIALDPVNGDLPHVGIPLWGRFKARSNAIQKLLVFIAADTPSGLKPGIWVNRLVEVLAALGISSGWLFQDVTGQQRPMSYFAEGFYEKLFAARERDPSLFEPGVDIYDDYHLERSLRRGATTRATNAKVPKDDINWINRWNTGGAEIVSGPMRVIYADQKQLLETFLRFSSAL